MARFTAYSLKYRSGLFRSRVLRSGPECGSIVGNGNGGIMKTLMTVARLKTRKKPGRYRCGPGLYLLISPTGTRSWVQRVVVDGARRDLGLGGYPTVSLSEARDTAHENRKLVRSGGNPTARSPRVPTFRRAAKLTHEANRARLSESSSSAWLAVLERLAYPVLGDRRVDRIDQADVLRVLTPIWTAKSATARKVRSAIRQVFSWAQASGYVDANPAGEAIDGALPALRKVEAHHRALPYADVPAALERIASSAASEPVKACLRFVALTAVRSGEARGATWSEIDLDAREWRIPAERMKTAAEHRVPLSREAVAVLESARALHSPAGYVFPSVTKPDRPVSYNLTRVLESAGLETTVHGFRSAFRTWASESTSYPHAVCEMALAHHVGSDVERSYARSDLFDKRRGLMDAWGQFATGGRAKVLHIHAAS